MRNGWIKLHTRFTENPVWRRDPTAWRVFEYLLSEAFYGEPQGTTSTTRYQIGNACLVNNNTAWSALLRLKKAKMVNISTNYRYSTVSICNWDKYQGDRQQPRQQLVTNSSLTRQHSYKNKNKSINTKVLIRTEVPKTTNPEIDKAFKYWEMTIGSPITTRVKLNRNACHNLIKKYGLEGISKLIDGVALSYEDQYAPRIADFTQLQSKLPDFLLWGKKKANNTKKGVVL
jgi:hypothetical protein